MPIARRVPHHPGDLPVAAESAEAGKERLELAPADQLEGRETQRYKSLAGPTGPNCSETVLGSHILGGAFQQATAFVAGASGESEIAQFHPALRIHQQIAGLDVSVNHAALVQEFERAQDAHQSIPQKIEVDAFARAAGSRLVRMYSRISQPFERARS